MLTINIQKISAVLSDTERELYLKMVDVILQEKSPYDFGSNYYTALSSLRHAGMLITSEDDQNSCESKDE